MKSLVNSIVVCAALLASLAMAQSGADPQGEVAKTTHHRRYVVTDLGTLPNGNGVFDTAFWITNNGLSTGLVSLLDGTLRGVLWNKGTITDMGTLGGPNSWAFGVNARGQASGFSETGTSDPNGEDFCGFGTHLVCLGFRWQRDTMAPLPTLGGNNGLAAQINSRGEVAGYVENATPDPNCPTPQVLQFKPVIWRANGNIHELPTLPGDPEGAAFGINENGHAVGTSGTCGTLTGDIVYLLEAHAVSWKDGTVSDLGNLGGTGAPGLLGNAAYSVNNRGDVVGHSDLPGDITTHAFLWTKKTGMQDLGALPGDSFSFALGINDAGEIVGTSFNPPSGVQNAVIWENGVPINLNTLVVPGFNAGLYLGYNTSINASGEIVGWGMTSSGDLHTFMATPVHGADSLPFSPSVRPRALSDAARQQLQRLGRFGLRGMAPQ